MAKKITTKERDQQGPDAVEKIISRQLDMMQDTSEKERQEVLTRKWVDDVEHFYNLTGNWTESPAFRPKVQIPELQYQMLAEASDLSDISPRPFLVKKGKSERDKDRERAFQAQWDFGQFSLEVLVGIIWALFSGNGYLQVGFDPDSENGEGVVWVEARHPATVYPDPYAKHDRDLAYVIFEDKMYIDEVRRRWPENGWRVKKKRPGAPNTSDTKLSLPPGPMSAIGGMPVGGANKGTMDDSRVVIRTAYVKDYSVLEVSGNPNKGNVGMLAKLKARPEYPHGRLIVESEGIVLLDTPNPLLDFPLVTIWGTPPLTSRFCPPPIKYTKDLQFLAEKMYTQTYENAVRLNNGVWFIDANTGIDLDEFGGVPGEAHTVAANSRLPEQKWPNAMPQQMVDLPEKLLTKQKEIQGFTPARRGIASQGNISAPLFDASVLQSQSVTRLRSRFLAASIQRLAEVVFGVMGKLYTTHREFPSFMGEDYELVSWAPIEDFDPAQYRLRVDKTSVRAFSQASLRMMIPMMKQFGIIDARTALEMLEVPDVEGIMSRLGSEAQAAAAMKAAGQKPGGKKR